MVGDYGKKRVIRYNYQISIVLPFLLADEGLTAEEIEFAIEKFVSHSVRLDRLKLLFESDDDRRRRWKIDDISSKVLKEIKRLREEHGFGYIKIGREIYRKFGIYLSGMTVRQLFKEGIDQIIEEKEKEEKRIEKIERLVNEGRIHELSLKDLVWFAMRKDNDEVAEEIKRRLNNLISKAMKLDVLDVL